LSKIQTLIYTSEYSIHMKQIEILEIDRCRLLVKRMNSLQVRFPSYLLSPQFEKDRIQYADIVRKIQELEK